MTETQQAPTRRIMLAIALPTLLVALGLVWVLATSEPATDRQVSSPLLDRIAPPLRGTTLGGDSYDIDRSRGEFVLVNFFATWCAPCRREHPDLVRFAKTHALLGDGSVVSVLYDDQTRAARQFFLDEGGDWPVVVDTEGRIALDYGVAGIPESFLVAPDGTVVAKIVGGVTAAGLDRILAEVRGR